MGVLYGVDGDLLERQYRNHLSGYLHWDQLVHAEDWLLFEKNIGAYICIDEVALSRGELYTVLTNKEAHGGKGSMIAIIKGTDVHTVTSVLLKLSRRRRYQVREITLDMAPNMEQIARICFPAAKRVTDRFHVQKLAYEAVQEMRVKARWEALDEESTQLAYAKACGKMYHAPVFANGDTRKQLLARSIYLLYKKESLWTQSQRIRAEILFKEYPDIKKGYYLSMRLGLIYHQCKFKDIALTRLARWYDEVDKSGFLTFGRVARSIQTHYLNIINFFERRATNAAAESFNAKIKAFRAQFRGVRDRAFSYIDLLNYMLKYKIPQIVTLTPVLIKRYRIFINNFIQEDCHFLLILNRFTGAAVRDGQLLFLIFISLFIKLPVHCENLF